MKKKAIKVVYKKLGREKADGLTYFEGKIIIDSRLKGKNLLETIVHECMHELWPELGEDEVHLKAEILGSTLWKEGFRKVDNDPMT